MTSLKNDVIGFVPSPARRRCSSLAAYTIYSILGMTAVLYFPISRT